MPYPNPVLNGLMVNVHLSLASATGVKIKIFTTAFRKVQEKDFGQEPAGDFEGQVDLVDFQNALLANGLYYVVAVTSQGQGRTMSKLLILR